MAGITFTLKAPTTHLQNHNSQPKATPLHLILPLRTSAPSAVAFSLQSIPPLRSFAARLRHATQDDMGGKALPSARDSG